MVRGLRVVDSGDGGTIVLVHGAMDRAGGLARAARHLGAHRVVRYDRRGYGGSSALGPGTLGEHVADLVEILTGASDEGRSPAAVIGHSFGGLVALGAARAAPELVAAVGAYEPPLPWVEGWPRGIEDFDGTPEEAADLVIERAVGAERWARAPAALRAVRRAEGGALLTEMRSLLVVGGDGWPSPLGPVSPPGSLGFGGRAPSGAAMVYSDLARRLGDLDVEVLDGCGHRAPMTAPAAYAAWCLRVAAPALSRDGADAGAAP